MPISSSTPSLLRRTSGVLAATFALCMGWMVDAAAESVSVQVQTAKLRSSPRHFAASTADLAFGDSLTVNSKNDDWYEVTLPDGRKGFVHASAVTGKRIVLSSRQVTLADVAVDEAQVYLAGKGFNGTVERVYSASERGVDYAALARMKSSRTISDESTVAFIESGKLAGSKS